MAIYCLILIVTVGLEQELKNSYLSPNVNKPVGIFCDRKSMKYSKQVRKFIEELTIPVAISSILQANANYPSLAGLYEES